MSGLKYPCVHTSKKAVGACERGPRAEVIWAETSISPSFEMAMRLGSWRPKATRSRKAQGGVKASSSALAVGSQDSRRRRVIAGLWTGEHGKSPCRWKVLRAVTFAGFHEVCETELPRASPSLPDFARRSILCGGRGGSDGSIRGSIESPRRGKNTPTLPTSNGIGKRSAKVGSAEAVETS